jgi:hypothetical protein
MHILGVWSCYCIYLFSYFPSHILRAPWDNTAYFSLSGQEVSTSYPESTCISVSVFILRVDIVGAPRNRRVTCTYLVVAADADDVRVRQACEGSRIVRSEQCRQNEEIAIAGSLVSDVT